MTKAKDEAAELETAAPKRVRRTRAEASVEKKAYPGSDEIMLFEPLLKLSADELEEKLDPKSDDPIPEEKVAGLLKLERSGQNRTEYVRVLCERLGVKSPYEVTNAGPDYTNDQRPITKLER